jgi:hypothetical protein
MATNLRELEGQHELRAELSGALLLPGTPDYDKGAYAWNASIQHKPALIVGAASAADVQAAFLMPPRMGCPWA